MVKGGGYCKFDEYALSGQEGLDVAAGFWRMMRSSSLEFGLGLLTTRMRGRDRFGLEALDLSSDMAVCRGDQPGGEKE